MTSAGLNGYSGQLNRVRSLVAAGRLSHEKFEEKIGVWPFTITRFAKRSESRTGTVAGETQVLESVTVNADEYRSILLKKGRSSRSHS